MKKITVFIETDETGTYNAYTLDDLPFGLMGEGDTVEKTMEDFIASIEEIKTIYKEENKVFPSFELEFK